MRTNGKTFRGIHVTFDLTMAIKLSTGNREKAILSILWKGVNNLSSVAGLCGITSFSGERCKQPPFKNHHGEDEE